MSTSILLVSYSKCWGNPPQFSPPQDKGGGRGVKQTNRKLRKKRHVGNSHGHLRTSLETDVISATYSLAIEGVKYGYVQDKPTGRLIKIEGENGGKEEGTAPAAHTTAPEQLACLAVNPCCECRPTSNCKTARCECRKANCDCMSC